jgi:hypothetical protein
VQTAIILAIDTIALIVMAQVSTIVGLTSAVVVATVALMSGSTVYQVLLPEIVPRRFWGAARRFPRRDDARRHHRRPGHRSVTAGARGAASSMRPAWR